MAKRSVNKQEEAVEKMSAFGGHPLALHLPATRGVAADAAGGIVAKLSELGLQDAEQLVGLVATEDGASNLRAALDVPKQELDGLVKEARKALPPAVLSSLEHPVPAMFGLGALEPPEGERGAVAAVAPVDVAALPPSTNLIAKLSRPVRSQGNRGTCVAHALSVVHEYYRNTVGRMSNADFSEQHLYHEIKLIDGSPTICGTWQKFGITVLANRGECREAVWPYNPNLPCNNNGTMPAKARTDAAKYKLGLTALPATNVPVIKSALAGNKPVAVSIAVYNSWYASPEVTRSGRITMPLANEPQVGGHAICLVGYQDDARSPGGGYFLLRNSWGAGWAASNPYGAGYGTLPYAYIAGYNWEATTLTSAISLEEGEGEPAAEEVRTVTIKVPGNVRLIIE